MTTDPNNDPFFAWADKDTGDERCAWCGERKPESDWVERAPGFRLCSQECADAY
jgi:hypothetical protein